MCPPALENTLKGEAVACGLNLGTASHGILSQPGQGEPRVEEEAVARAQILAVDEAGRSSSGRTQWPCKTGRGRGACPCPAAVRRATTNYDDFTRVNDDIVQHDHVKPDHLIKHAHPHFARNNADSAGREHHDDAAHHGARRDVNNV